MARARETTFNGPCKGGPWDGKSYAHWSVGPVPIYKPLLEMPPAGLHSRMEDLVIQPAEIGRYEWVVDAWFWIPAKAVR